MFDDEQMAAGFFGGFDHASGFGCRQAHRFFAKDVRAGFQGKKGLRRVQVVGGTNDNYGWLFRMQEGLQRGVGTCLVLCCQLVGPVREDIGDRGEPSAACDLCGMAPADVPGAY